jgi:acetyltransferase-like isoleucine patch superfamily enzyme
MRIGEGVMVDDLCHLDARGCADGEFVLGDGVIIGRGSILNAKGGPLELGPRVNVGTNCMLFADGPLRIGADTMLAGGCYINGGGYAIDGPVDRPMREQAVQMSGVTIEEDCWLGAGVTVVAGVRIGRGSVIGAGALVNRDIPPYSVAVGVPARVVRRRQGAGLQRAEGAADAAPGAATGPGRAQRRKA